MKQFFSSSSKNPNFSFFGNNTEYADPELDALDESDANLLDSLDFDDTDAEKDKAKKAALEKLSKANENKAQQVWNESVHSFFFRLLLLIVLFCIY